MSSIVQSSAFSSANLTISPPKVNPKTQARSAYLNYDGKSLVMQTPSLPTPFGLSVFDKEGPPKYSVDLALRGYQENPKVKAFFNALTQLDEFMINEGVKNAKLWFKLDDKPKAGQSKEDHERLLRSMVTAFYTPCVKFGKDKEGNPTPYPPNLKLKLNRDRDSGDFECKFYDPTSKGNPNASPLKGVPVEEMLVRKSELTALIQVQSVWLQTSKFGLTWKAVQIRLDSVPSGISGYGFQEEDDGGEFSEPAEFAAPPSRRPAAAPVIQDEDSDEESEEEVAPAPVPQKAAPSTTSPAVVDSDDEEEAPAPVPKKTTVMKKKVVTKK
jgi:hypothetical protein